MLLDDRSRIVLVDDDEEFRGILRDWLLPVYDTVSLASGEALFEELPSLAPDLLILDLALPGPNGFKICRRLRAHPRFRNVPVLFLTGSARNQDFISGLEAGGAGYLTKPVERGSLLRTVHGLLRI